MRTPSVTISSIKSRSRYLFLPLLVGLVSAIATVPFAASASESNAIAWSGWAALDTIVVLAPSDQFIDKASAELESYLAQISGRSWSVSSADIPGPAVRLSVDPTHPALLGMGDEAVRLFANDQGIHIIGNSPVAARHGAYILLEQLGVRWFFKSDVWTVVPDSLVDIGGLDLVREPDFTFRVIFQGGARGVNHPEFLAWQQRNRMWGATDQNAAHTYPYIFPASEQVAHPEWYCWTSGWANQLNPDHPDVLAGAIDFARTVLTAPGAPHPFKPDVLPPGTVYINPNDGTGWCDPWSEDKEAITDKVFNLANEVAKAVGPEFPDQNIGVLSYSMYDLIPTIPLEPNLLVTVTTRAVYFYQFQERLQAFIDKGVVTGFYDYFDVSVWDKDYPPSTEAQNGFYQLLDRIPLVADMGATQFHAEAGDGWGAKGLLYYATAAQMWNPNIGLETVLDDFYSKAFGPAATTMEQYYNWLNSDPIINERSIFEAYSYLDAAESLATGNPEVLERIRHAQYYVRYLWLSDIYSTGDEIEDTKKLYEFIHRIRDTYVLYHGYRETGPAAKLTGFGLTDAEIDALKNTTLPAPAEARSWMDEAMTWFAGITSPAAPYISIRNIEMAPLAETGYPALTPPLVRNKTAIVYASAGSTVTVEGTFKGQLVLSDPQGKELDVRYYDTPTPQADTITFTATVTGLYSLRLWGTITSTSAPAAYLMGTPDGGINRWISASHSFYFYVPQGTPRFVLGAENVYGWGANVTVKDPNGLIVLQQACTDPDVPVCEWEVENPTPGLWQMDGTTIVETNYWLLGIAPLIWHDPNQLLVPESAFPPIAADDDYTVKPGAVLAASDAALFFTDAMDALVGHVVLPDVGDSTRLRVAAHNIGIDNADTVQLKITYDATIVSLSGVQCIGMYVPGLVNMTGTMPGVGTYAICAALNGPLTDEGPIIEFTLTREGAGDATVSLSEVDTESEPLGTTFIKAGVKFRDMVPPVIVDRSASVDVLSIAATPMPEPTTPVGVLANDSDLQDDPLVITVQTGTAHGVLVLNPTDGSFAYAPEPGFAGIDSFTYTISDGINTSATATVTIAVGATISGTVSLQVVSTGSAAFAAIAPTVTLIPGGGGANATVDIASDGTFAFGGVTAGVFTIRAAANGFQPAERVGLTVGESDVAMPDVELKIGLVNNDSWVDGPDLSLVVVNFGYFTADRTDAFDNWVDLNGDGAVSALDISPVIANIGLSGTQSW